MLPTPTKAEARLIDVGYILLLTYSFILAQLKHSQMQTFQILLELIISPHIIKGIIIINVRTLYTFMKIFFTLASNILVLIIFDWLAVSQASKKI